MSVSSSFISSVVASSAPLLCEALHLSKLISPGTARGRFENKVKGSRSELRKLRNKVYVRMLSGQNAAKHLIKFRAQGEAFIEAYKEDSSDFEMECLRRRLEVTEHAVAASEETKAQILIRQQPPVQVFHLVPSHHLSGGCCQQQPGQGLHHLHCLRLLGLQQQHREHNCGYH